MTSTDPGTSSEGGPPLVTGPLAESPGRALTFQFGRYLLATLMLSYGFSKVVGLQFLVTESMVDTRLRDLAGIELVWAYHGSSPVMRFGTALAEIAAGGLVLFRRTTRLGLYATLLIGMQLLLVNLAWPIAPTMVVFILGVAIGMLVLDRAAVGALVRDHLLQPPRAATFDRAGGAIRPPGWVKAIVVLALVGFAIGFNIWVRDINTPEAALSGVWEPVGDPEIDRLYIDDAPYCAARFHDDPTIWRGVCFIDEQARTLAFELRGPAIDDEATGPRWELDATYSLGDRGTRLLLDDHHRGEAMEFRRRP